MVSLESDGRQDQFKGVLVWLGLLEDITHMFCAFELRYKED